MSCKVLLTRMPRCSCHHLQQPQTAAVAPRRCIVARQAASGSTAAGTSLPIRMQGNHLKVTPAIQEYAQNKISHAVEPYQQIIKTVDARVYARGGDTGTKEQTNDDLYAAIDLSCDKVARSLRKLKEKAIGRGNWPGRAGKGAPKLAEMMAEPSDDDGVAVPSDDEVESVTRKLSTLPDNVKKTKVFYLDPMSVEDACEQLELVDHDFFVYLDEDSRQTQVVYKRHGADSGYGLLIPIQSEALPS